MPCLLGSYYNLQPTQRWPTTHMFNFKGEESDVHRLYAVETPKNNNCGKTMKVLLTKH